jgi:hypothetical protein
MTTTETSTYDVGPYAGKLYFEFSPKRAGPHQLKCWFAGSEPMSMAILALSDHPLGSVTARRLRLAITSVVALAGLLLLLFLRRRHRTSR